MIRAVVFDLDGTILNTITTIAHFVNKTLQNHHISPITEEECKMFIGSGARKLIERALLSKGKISENKLEKILPEYNAAYDSDPYYLTEKYQGIDELLTSIKNKKLALAVISNKPDNTTKQAVSYFFPGIFSEVHGGRDGIPLKPDPKAGDELLSALGVRSDEIVYVGDSGVDMQFGKAIGAALTLGAAWGFRSESELLECGADKVFLSPRDMMQFVLSYISDN